VTIERTWVRVLISTPWRMLGTALGLFVLIIAGPLVLIIADQALLGVLLLVLGLAFLAALVLALLPGGRRWG
jgi:hypothetical protein